MTKNSVFNTEKHGWLTIGQLGQQDCLLRIGTTDYTACPEHVEGMDADFLLYIVIPAKAGIQFFHFDCYRLKNEKDILELDFKKIALDPLNIIAVEWPEKIKEVLPKKIITINFKFIDENKREIIF